MLTQPLLDNLTHLGLAGFRTALEAQWQNPEYTALTFEERLGLLVDLECTRRANNLLHRRLQTARFALAATVEDLDLAAHRGLARAQVLELAQAAWVPRHLNVLVLGATGAGKSYLACALGRAVCEAGFAVRYERTSRLLQTLELARADGSYPQVLRALARLPLLVLDDWLRDPLTRSQAQDLLEIGVVRNPDDTLRAHRHPDCYSSSCDRLVQPPPRPHARRCHPRPSHSQCLSFRTQRRFDAKNPDPIAIPHPLKV
jgi:DNA replication protein DnaC